jgi:glycosyltransferase involved in cell wall biosynthesis
MNLTIVIPAFNESAALGDFLSELTTKIDTELTYEITIVNDGSTDNTGDIAKSYDVKVIDHLVNLGYGAALKTGIKASDADYILICDSDGQHTIKDINKMLGCIGDAPMVIGERGQGSFVQRNRSVGKGILKYFANFLMNESIPDLNSGLRLIDRAIISRYLHILPDSFSASTTMTLLFLKRKLPIKWLEIQTLERIGTSSVRQFRHGLYTLLLIVRIVMLFNPLKIFTMLSAVFFIFGACWGGFYLAKGGLSVFAGINILTGVLLFMFGLVADQISFLRLEKYE